MPYTSARLEGSVRRLIEEQLLEASYEVAPQMTETERVAFLQDMMETLSADDIAAML